MPTGVHFDDYADNYDAALNQGLTATGEGKDYFARSRIQWLTQCLSERSVRPRSVLDYGCGDGSSSALLLDLLEAESVVGLDNSQKSLELARRHYGYKRLSFLSVKEYSPCEEVDLAYCSGVFHHIPPAERASAVNYIWRLLRPGALFAFWENNPWNLGTRYVMSRIPFDRDAITLTPPEACALLRDGGFRILRTSSLFFFPKRLKWLRWLEPHLSRWPLGGQYQVLCRKAEKTYTQGVWGSH